MKVVSKEKHSMRRLFHHLIKSVVEYPNNIFAIVMYPKARRRKYFFQMESDANPYIEYICASCVLAFKGENSIGTR